MRVVLDDDLKLLTQGGIGAGLRREEATLDILDGGAGEDED